MAGRLVNGEWQTKNSFASEDGSFKRDASAFRRWITPDGKPDEEGKAAVPAAEGRYHLYVSYACPWAHRTLIMRALKGLQDLIPVSVVHPHMLDNGWIFATDFPGATGDDVHGSAYLHQLYTLAKSDYSGKVTVPVLWDKQEQTIVNNESADILRIFNTAFNELTGNTNDYYPAAQQTDIDAINERVYTTINNGVYKCGFAEKQSVYEENIVPLFESLDWLEHELGTGKPYLLGEQITEADIRLLTTLLRFDAVYYVHFKCNVRQIREYPALSRYVQRLYGHPAIKPTVHFDHIKAHYYYSHAHINPHRIVPLGPLDAVASL